MTTENKEELLRLYKLLWEQIKDEHVIGLMESSDYIRINTYEQNVLYKHISDSIKYFENPKSFVQRMITELDNEIK